MTKKPDETVGQPDATDAEEREPALKLVAPPEQAPQTPSDATPVPQPDESGHHDLNRPEYFLNRELTWLNFNFRVLHEAEDPRTPLLERVKFLSIVSSNLDEFVMKRIGGLKQQVGAGVTDLTVDGRTPQQQIDECYRLIALLVERRREAYLALVGDLEAEGIVITTFDRLDEGDRDELRDYYLNNIFPLVTPQATDPAHPFPFISNLSLNLLVTLHFPKEPAAHLARVKVPVGTGIPRFLRIEGKKTFVTLESVMSHNLEMLFPGMDIESCETFRVTRNANTEMEEDKADDLLGMIESELRERKFAPVVRLEVARGMTAQHRGMLASELGLNEDEDVFEMDGVLGLRDLMELVDLDGPGFHYEPHHPIDHPNLTTDRNIFHTLRDEGSILLNHPYESFPTSVERFLREASVDPKVRAIKMTIYRTSEESKAIDYLIDAARNGKQVAVVVELKARFDEGANIRWAARLEEAGIHVTYGVVGLKTHCKVILVVRQDYSGLQRYAHIGTGNYHSGTARIYNDLGLLTSDPKIGQDCTELFNYLTTGYKPKRRYRKILVAPKQLKKALLDKIEREIRTHSDESPGLIQFKMNALEDAEITRALYRASQYGVQVDLIVRDTCRLRPGIPGLSEKVCVVSVVGRFLEHCRIFHFRNGGEEEYFIGSADAMKRNLNSRVEVLTPVERPELREELRFMLDTQLNDHRSAWEMSVDGSYVQRQPRKGKNDISCQESLIRWADDRFREATRLRRRKPRTLARRNIREES
jgi:polyphosphate kinase